VTRRQWFLDVGGGVMLAGWSGADLEAAELPPGVFEASREHLGHALAGHTPAAGAETELVQIRGVKFQPAFFTPDQYRVIRRLVALMLGEPESAAVDEIAEWIDLTTAESSDVRALARALSPAHRTLAMHYYGPGSVRRLEEFDAQKVTRDGFAWLAAVNFAVLPEPEQIAILKSISDDRPNPEKNAGTEFFVYLKERVIRGFYTSRTGLDELGYRGNGFYASPPGCEHLYG
jgi:hypothetical protein